MGSERKRVRFEDEEEFIEKRKSSRVLALEKKKQQEKERKSTLEFEKRKNSTKNNAEKGKSIISDKEHLGDFNEDDKHDDPTKKKALYQEISSSKAIQEGRHAHNNESTSKNASSLNNVPDKHFLENVLDILQRKDKDDLFGEPINPDTVKNYHIVKKPMDFRTMRAKVVEGMYSSLTKFKRDVFLLCINARIVYPKTSRHQKVAEDIRCHAIKVFEDLNAEHENLNMKVSPSKRCQSKKQHERQNRISPKLLGRNNVTRSKVPETEKRLMCWPPNNKSLVSEFLNAKKPNIQLKISPNNYKASLLRFVKDCGPIAQKVAANKLEGLKFRQLSNGNTLTSNIVKDIPTSQLISKAITNQPNSIAFQLTPSINVHSSMSHLHSETTYFSKEVKSSLLCLGTPYQYGDFHAIMGSSKFNNNSYQNQVISLQGSSSSKTPEVKISRSTNYNEGGDDVTTKQIKANPQISDDDDQQHNLTLNLF